MQYTDMKLKKKNPQKNVYALYWLQRKLSYILYIFFDYII